MIHPTVGRKVWFYPNAHQSTVLRVFDSKQPCDATIVYVWNDRMVNLHVVGPTGIGHAFQSVKLLQDDDAPPEGMSQHYATWMPYQTGQAKAAETAASQSPRAVSLGGHNVMPFRVRDEQLGMPALAIARVCHEVNRAYCEALGDFSQPSWEDAPDWQRSSALNGVMLHVVNPDAGPQASHESWMKEKVDDGWVYGPEKKPELKQHPCIVPFDQLPREQQAKDYIFRAVVHALNPFEVR